MSDGVGCEPFTGAELRRFFEVRYGARLARQRGSHISMVLDDGRVLRCMDVNQPVTKTVMRWNAKVLGLTYTELRSAIAPIQRKNKPRYRPQKPPPPPTVSKKDALASLDELIGDAKNIKNSICNGRRDPAAYRRIHEAVKSARGRLRTHNKVGHGTHRSDADLQR